MSTQLWADDFGAIVTEDFFGMMLGTRIAAGQFRIVYEFRMRPDYVVKFERDPILNRAGRNECNFSNALEWHIWNAAKGTRFEKWFAPVESISPAGHVLVMAKVEPVTEVPRNVPEFLTDLKAENFGLYEGRVVACDYGNNFICSTAFKRAKMGRVYQTKADGEPINAVRRPK